MEDYNIIQDNVYNFLRRQNQDVDPRVEFTIGIDTLSTMTNYDYLINIYDKTSNEVVNQFIYILSFNSTYNMYIYTPQKYPRIFVFLTSFAQYVNL